MPNSSYLIDNVACNFPHIFLIFRILARVTDTFPVWSSSVAAKRARPPLETRWIASIGRSFVFCLLSLSSLDQLVNCIIVSLV